MVFPAAGAPGTTGKSKSAQAKPTERLTDQLARSLPGPPAGKSEIIYADTLVKRFGLRVRDGGSRRWVVDYETPDGRSHRVTLGDPAIVTCAAARQRARQLRAEVMLGGDPSAARAAARRAVTLGARAKEFLAASEGRVRPSTLNAQRRHLMVLARPLHSLSVASVGRGDLTTLLASITRDKGPVAANRCATTLVGLFGWLVREHGLDGNPLAGVRLNTEVSRERVLSDSELTRIWEATGEGGDFSRIVRLLLLTGCRRSEIGSLRWSELAGDMFVLPASRSKNNRAHEVPLVPLAIAQLPPRTGVRDTVFGKDGASGFSGWSLPKERLDKRIGSDVASWTLHDFRRTLSTWLHDHDVEPHVVEALLGHVGGSARVARVYNRAPYARQKRDALTKWATHIAALVGQDVENVTTIARTVG